MTNNITKATAIIVRAFAKRNFKITRKDVTVSEVVCAYDDKYGGEYIKTIRGTYLKSEAFDYDTVSDNLIVRSNMFRFLTK